MAASQISIVNSALVKLGASPVLAITDNVKRAKAMAAMWEPSRDRLLRAFRWSFAMVRTKLPALADVPSWGFGTQFQLPADCLRLDFVSELFVGLSLSDYRDSDESDFALEGRKILCDLAVPLPIRYVARVTDVSLYDACFAEALACRLALDCCEEITQSSTKKADIRTDLKDVLIDAVRTNAIEKPPIAIADDSWMLGRL